ncbi:MAG: SWIB/MDM2 domain-containing protein [Thermodesulfovibrionales bacterium]|jgi:chromatin remodeling complex protein RSC6
MTETEAAKVTKKSSPNPAFVKAVPPIDALAKIVEYIIENNLQNAKNKRNINADENLLAVFDKKNQVSIFEMTKLVNKHLS